MLKGSPNKEHKVIHYYRHRSDSNNNTNNVNNNINISNITNNINNVKSTSTFNTFDLEHSNTIKKFPTSDKFTRNLYDQSNNLLLNHLQSMDSYFSNNDMPHVSQHKISEENKQLHKDIEKLEDELHHIKYEQSNNNTEHNITSNNNNTIDDLRKENEMLNEEIHELKIKDDKLKHMFLQMQREQKNIFDTHIAHMVSNMEEIIDFIKMNSFDNNGRWSQSMNNQG